MRRRPVTILQLRDRDARPNGPGPIGPPGPIFTRTPITRASVLAVPERGQKLTVVPVGGSVHVADGVVS